MSRRAARAEERWALSALGVIMLVTVGWWGLALWPLPASAPDWLIRTRQVCFGNPRDALPPPGGWILLVSQPLGMLAVLLTVWGGSLRDGLRRLARSGGGRAVLAMGCLVALAGMGGVGWRLATAQRVADPVPGELGRIVAFDDRAPALHLVDQRGDSISLDHFQGRPVLVTFAFGHCETVCPSLVHAARTARQRLSQLHPVLLVVTLDPWRDTVGRLAGIAARWELGSDEFLLGGSVPEVEATLNSWKVPRVRNQVTGEVIHPSVTYVVGPAGELAYLTDGSASGVERALGRLASGQ